MTVSSTDKRFFSIIVPTCNRNELLAQSLDCLAPEAQSLNHSLYEVIVTDDGKNNEAKEIIKKNYSWVKWVEGPKKGPAANRNNGAYHAKGEWLVFLDDDCIPDTDIMKIYYQYISINPTIKVFEGKITASGKQKSPLEYAPLNLDGGHLWSCNFAINSDFFKSIKGFDENFKYPHMEDVDLNDRILKTGSTILFASNAIVSHPWRKLTDGRKLGMYQEMYIYYYAKRRTKVSLAQLLINISRVHIALLKTSLFSIDIFHAVKIMFQHLFTVIVHYNKWKRTYVAKS